MTEASIADQFLKYMPILATAAQKLGLTPQQAVLASNAVGSVLESTVKEIPKSKIVDTLKGKKLKATKKHFLIPTSSMTIELE